MPREPAPGPGRGTLLLADVFAYIPTQAGELSKLASLSYFTENVKERASLILGCRSRLECLSIGLG